jgi:molybdopterin-guanine dinucleotide biosynthesis protein A
LNPAGRESDLEAAAPDAAGFVLAGGRSSRMGADKALAHFAGQPMVVHALEILRQAGLRASIAGARSPLDAFAPVVEDSQPDLGPLGGICAALASTGTRWAVFLPVDVPLLPASLIIFLLNHACITGAAVTLTSVNGFAQTFPAVIDKAVLPELEIEIQASRGGCFSAFQTASARLGRPVSVLAAELLVQCGQVTHPGHMPAARWFVNVNAPKDLGLATAYSRAADRVI